MSGDTQPVRGRAILVAVALLSALNACGWLVPRASSDEARRTIDAPAGGESPERVARALHLLASRGEAFDAAFVGRLLASSEPLLVDYAMTHDLSRGDAAIAQADWLAEHPNAAAPAFFLHHQVRRMTRADLAAYFASSR